MFVFKGTKYKVYEIRRDHQIHGGTLHYNIATTLKLLVYFSSLLCLLQFSFLESKIGNLNIYILRMNDPRLLCKLILCFSLIEDIFYIILYYRIFLSRNGFFIFKMNYFFLEMDSFIYIKVEKFYKY